MMFHRENTGFFNALGDALDYYEIVEITLRVKAGNKGKAVIDFYRSSEEMENDVNGYRRVILWENEGGNVDAPSGFNTLLGLESHPVEGSEYLISLSGSTPV